MHLSFCILHAYPFSTLSTSGNLDAFPLLRDALWLSFFSKSPYDRTIDRHICCQRSELTNKRVQKLLRNSSNNASLCTNGEVCAELFYPSECRWHQVKGMQTTGAATGQLTLVPNISQLLYDNIQYSRFKFKSNTDQPSNSI